MGEFDALVGALDYPMYIVTATDGDRLGGCLVGFASQCGIAPSRFTVWLSKNNHTYQVARGAAHLGVHVPRPRDRELAELFGSVTGFERDKFAAVDWRRSRDGVPLLVDCPQWFVGRILGRADTGDHEALLLEPTEVGDQSGAGQVGFQSVVHLEPGTEA